MKDPLEEFVHQNRADFDDKEPSAKVWGRIEKRWVIHPSRYGIRLFYGGQRR